MRLAAFTRPYLDTTGFPDGWKGVLFGQEMVEKWVGYAYANGIQLFAYSNGDAGIDLSLAAIEKAIAANGEAAERRTIDCPSASPSIMEAIGTAVTRTTLSGQVLGPQECVDPYTALLGFTRNAAYTSRDEAIKGTITAGKIADLVILDRNPLTVRAEAIKDIEVVETVKRGTVIYAK